MKEADKYIQSVRIPERRVRILLDALDSRDINGSRELRKFERRSFRTDRVILHVLDAHHNIESSFQVIARNLSPNGMAFIHGQMLLPNKSVLVHIPRKPSGYLSVIGRVAHCRHVEGMVHEVGLKFMASKRPSQKAAETGSGGGPSPSPGTAG